MVESLDGQVTTKVTYTKKAEMVSDHRDVIVNQLVAYDRRLYPASERYSAHLAGLVVWRPLSRRLESVRR